ncbi:unnamed protein product [Hymenolepis diminuta]|uniref:SCP domain-containing protein n=1 Tax=Hymenolepis diminuta TaxID=6216 RepID=A0A0R3S916_HYMDI|nr:unnamed protein product [Hymenolepis diminuta]VUZ54228.1 unnamed protein product [Hymenolepis diminuta]
MKTYIFISALAIGILLTASTAHSKRCCCRKHQEDYNAEIESRFGGGDWENGQSWPNNGRWENVETWQNTESWQGDDSDNQESGDSEYGGGDGNLSPQMKKVLDMHNELRRKVARGQLPGQPPSNKLKDLKWNPELARMAQAFTDTCRIGHNSYEERKTKTFQMVGQNYATYSTIDKCVNSWIDEYKDYNYNFNNCSSVCGHYTQMVWASTTDLGCGLSQCYYLGNKQNFLVCHYGPSGNYEDERPY